MTALPWERAAVSAVSPFRSDVTLNSNEVHVIRFRLDTPWRGAMRLLSRSERDRASRLAFEADRRRFVVSHAFARFVLAHYFRQSPANLEFCTGPRGKPRVTDIGCDVRFNLTHSGDRALIAVATGREVGIDIERHRWVDVMPLARSCFSATECADLAAISDAREQLAGFYRCWTRKEALVKATGEGLGYPLDAFDVEIAPDRLSDVVLEHDSPSVPHRWTIVPLRVQPGYSAAVATEAGPFHLRLWSQPTRIAC
jgi:4'-phosphopantetheinyl transferase